MYLQYIQERNPEMQVLETDKGFATYKYLTLDGHPAVYIEDIYVLPQHRNEDHASAMSQSIQNLAKERGCQYLLGTVCPEAKGSTASLKVLLSHGMQLLKSENNLIWFYLEMQ